MPHTIPTDRTDIEWRNESTQKPPNAGGLHTRSRRSRNLKKCPRANCNCLDWRFSQCQASLGRNKKTYPQAVWKKKGVPADIQTAFHAHRMKQAQQSRLLNMLAVEIQPNFQLDNARAPDIYAALCDVYDTPNDKPFLLPLNQLLGFIGAHEWHKKA